MSEKEKKIEENLQDDDLVVNGSEISESVETDSDENQNLGSPTYEELLDKKEELEGLLLRANADLDNAFKRTLTEVEKAHKYGTEKLLMELLPIVDNLENALNNLSHLNTQLI